MQTLDYRNMPCPQPVLNCRNAIKDGNLNQFSVLVDNEPASENVARFLSQHGFKTTCTKQDDNFKIIAELDSDQVSQPILQVTDNSDSNDNNENKIVVFITTDTMGRGDDMLGEKLMQSFLSTLPELGSSLWRLILLNGAVKLSTSKNHKLQVLKDLEKSGVSILVCGTCLAHFGLLEEKQVGSTSNMLDIVTVLQLADKVIRP